MHLQGYLVANVLAVEAPHIILTMPSEHTILSGQSDGPIHRRRWATVERLTDGGLINGF